MMRSRRPRPSQSQRGVTLLELMIAITLVAGLSTGMLMAMRTSLLTYQKTADKLAANRRFVKTRHILYEQIAAAMPVQQSCPPDQAGPPASASFLSGTAAALRLVSSYSIAEGARGLPQIVEYRVMEDERGGVRLVATERPYTGPQSTAAACGNELLPPAPSSFEFGSRPGVLAFAAQSYVLAEHLAFCRFSYHEPYDQIRYIETEWLPLWDKPALPAGVRIEMQPLASPLGGLPVLGVTVPIQVNRDLRLVYDDRS